MFINKSPKNKVIIAYLSNNKITELPDLSSHKSLTYLAIQHNKLIKLPPLPPSLQRLFANNNKIENTDSLASLTHLQEVQIHYNKITHLTIPTMTIIYASYNELQELNFTSGKTTLQYLFLQHNKLTTLPQSDYSQINNINVSFNRLRSLPIIPPIKINNNPTHEIQINIGNNCLVDKKIPDITKKCLKEQSRRGMLFFRGRNNMDINYHYLSLITQNNFLTQYPSIRSYRNKEDYIVHTIFRVNNTYYNAAMYIQRFWKFHHYSFTLTRAIKYPISVAEDIITFF